MIKSLNRDIELANNPITNADIYSAGEFKGLDTLVEDFCLRNQIPSTSIMPIKYSIAEKIITYLIDEVLPSKDIGYNNYNIVIGRDGHNLLLNKSFLGIMSIVNSMSEEDKLALFSDAPDEITLKLDKLGIIVTPDLIVDSWDTSREEDKPILIKLFSKYLNR